METEFQYQRCIKSIQVYVVVSIFLFMAIATVEFLYESTWFFLYIFLIIFNLKTYSNLEKLKKRNEK